MSADRPRKAEVYREIGIPEVRPDIPMGSLIIVAQSINAFQTEQDKRQGTWTVGYAGNMNRRPGEQLLGRDIEITLAVRVPLTPPAVPGTTNTSVGRINVIELAEISSRNEMAQTGPNIREHPIKTSWDPASNNYILLGSERQKELSFALMNTHRRVEIDLVDGMPTRLTVAQHVAPSEAGLFVTDYHKGVVDGSIGDEKTPSLPEPSETKLLKS